MADQATGATGIFPGVGGAGAPSPLPDWLKNNLEDENGDVINAFPIHENWKDIGMAKDFNDAKSEDERN